MTSSSGGGKAAIALLKGFPRRQCPRCSRTSPRVRPSGAASPAPPATILQKFYSTTPTEPPPPSPATSADAIKPPVPPPPQPPPPSDGAPTTAEGDPAALSPGPDAEAEADEPEIPPNKLTYPITPKATHTLFGGLILTRPPILTRDLTPFEESFFLYQKRLNERLTLPFMPGLYFKPDTPQQLDWNIKIRRRKMVASREIGHYQRRGREAWNDEELVGSKLASTEHVYNVLLDDAVSLVNDEGERIKDEDLVPMERPTPRRSEADEKNDTKRLDRKMDRTLYLVVQDRFGDWRFPHAPIAMEEGVHQTAARCLREHCGVNMHTWIVGRMPVAHIVTDPVMNPDNPSEIQRKGKKIFFLKGRIMNGQADISKNTLGLKNFLWLTREELQEKLDPIYFHKVRNMMADR